MHASRVETRSIPTVAQDPEGVDGRYGHLARGGGDGAGRDRAIAAEPFQDNPCHVFRGGVIAKVGPVSVEEIPRTDDAFTKGGNGHLQESVAHWTAALPIETGPIMATNR